MQKFKEFQGRDLDECIQAACSYYDSPREKLEIEILQDAKSGIFGIVGARKAKIRARRASLADTVQSILGNENQPSTGTAGARGKKDGARNSGRHEKKGPGPGSSGHAEQLASTGRDNAPVSHDAPRSAEAAPSGMEVEPPMHKKTENREELLQPAGQAPDAGFDEDGGFDSEATDEGLRQRPLDELDAERLEKVAREVVGMLARPVAGRDTPITVERGNGRLRVKVDWQGDAGLLIGREGQTLAAMQYLASRMISRAMNSIVRVQLDIGEYRSRQDDKLRDLAHALARKARESGKPCSTRPLSSYHRRIIHLCLQSEPDVQTRSSGEGPLKRVVISPKRANGKS